MKIAEFLSLYLSQPFVSSFQARMSTSTSPQRLRMTGFAGSSPALIAATLAHANAQHQLFVLSDKEAAAYFHNDLEKLREESQLESDEKSVLLFPSSWRRPYDSEWTDNANVLQRAEVLHRLEKGNRKLCIVTYPEALSEKVITQRLLKKNTLKIHVGEQLSMDFVIEALVEHHFERVDFVIEPGQYALRGGILDLFSFSGDYPFRIEFFGDAIESIRSFDAVTQLSRERLQEIAVLPDIQNQGILTERTSLLAHFPASSWIWIDDLEGALFVMEKLKTKAQEAYDKLQTPQLHLAAKEIALSADELLQEIKAFSTVEFGPKNYFTPDETISFDFAPQPTFNKQFELLIKHGYEQNDLGYTTCVLSENEKQIARLERAFFEMSDPLRPLRFVPLKLSLHEGFIDHRGKICAYTDHQIFERYHRFSSHRQVQNRETITLKELYDLKPGDYVTHIDHGIGRFGGLEKTDIGGHQQETIRLVYKDNDVLFISIHALHKISRYSGKEGQEPALTRLGSNTWNVLKNKAKQRLKDIAKELIQLYARRKAAPGFAFSGDSYLQNELEASFFYEDTPDQFKATQDVKKDMESASPMDRLICGDVGFGKTEIAIRAAFKAVSDGKQVAVLVPTTILAFQHYKTFSERLKDMPCRVDYISRFRTSKEKKEILKTLENGQLDILIGTHRIVGKDVKFKDLGLMIIDEEQKFGVAMKEKLKEIKVNVDSLALSATPIPRTLQFSLMGARDLSIISTPPPNRYPVHTEIHAFDEEIIRDAIVHELSRGGQVFFVHSRVQNIMDIAGLVQRLVPDARVGIGHGQMDGDKLEEVILDFIEGETDILIATKIVENGLDIPNANTMIINEAQAYGLSELHQLRGRVGRSNKKSFCYLISPPSYMLSDEAKKRLRAIEEFSEIGSGFNIAMRDLDIRGAGNVLGAEQSGFIADIGFDTYHKILNETMTELKETEFKELYADATADANPVVEARECVMETDLELLLPDTYVNNTTERLNLYKQLDALNTDEELEEFRQQLMDRFGPVPKPALQLIEAIRMRRLAKKIGLEKLVLKRQKLVGTFIADAESPYYRSDAFEKVLQYVKNNVKSCEFKEVSGHLTITFAGVLNVASALEKLAPLAPTTLK